MEVTALATSCMSVAGYECDKTKKKEKEEMGEDGGCKVNIAPFNGWGRKGSTWAIGVGILRVFAEPIPIRCSVWGLP